MKNSEAKKHAKSIVHGMLNGRCQPEVDDVEHCTMDSDEQELIMTEIRKILVSFCSKLESK